MILKIDLAKAYDSLSWQLIKDTLKAVGFLAKLVSIIMDCVTSHECSVEW